MEVLPASAELVQILGSAKILAVLPLVIRVCIVSQVFVGVQSEKGVYVPCAWFCGTPCLGLNLVRVSNRS